MGFVYHLCVPFRRFGTFTGGIELPDEKHATLESPIVPCAVPDRLRVPLALRAGVSAAPVVGAGDIVEAGQVIARADDDGAVDVLAPLGGRVAGVMEVSVVGTDSFFASEAIELVELSPPPPPQQASEVFDWRRADPQELRDRIAEGGLTTHRPPVSPLAGFIATARKHNCRTLIANVMENQPYVTGDHRLLVEHGREVVRGLALLASAIEAERIMLAVDRRRTDYFSQLADEAEQLAVDLIALPHKYPIANNPILVKVLTRREMPLGGSVEQTGATVIDASSCLASYRRVACEQVTGGRVVTISGEMADECGNYFVPFGVECASLIGPAGGATILGGPMTGLPCAADAVITPASDALLAIDAQLPKPPGPCIRCGWCRDHCPARLNVAMLNDAFELGLIKAADRAGVQACVECGVCTYVCPAGLPLRQRTTQLKRTINMLRRRMPLFTESK